MRSLITDGWIELAENDDDSDAGFGFFDPTNLPDEIKKEALSRYAIGSDGLKQWCLGHCLAAVQWAEGDGNVDEL